MRKLTELSEYFSLSMNSKHREAIMRIWPQCHWEPLCFWTFQSKYLYLNLFKFLLLLIRCLKSCMRKKTKYGKVFVDWFFKTSRCNNLVNKWFSIKILIDRFSSHKNIINKYLKTSNGKEFQIICLSEAPSYLSTYAKIPTGTVRQFSVCDAQGSRGKIGNSERHWCKNENPSHRNWQSYINQRLEIGEWWYLKQLCRTPESYVQGKENEID